jgi:hypothetical protein
MLSLEGTPVINEVVAFPFVGALIKVFEGERGAIAGFVSGLASAIAAIHRMFSMVSPAAIKPARAIIE